MKRKSLFPTRKIYRLHFTNGDVLIMLIVKDTYFNKYRLYDPFGGIYGSLFYSIREAEFFLKQNCSRVENVEEG